MKKNKLHQIASIVVAVASARSLLFRQDFPRIGARHERLLKSFRSGLLVLRRPAPAVRAAAAVPRVAAVRQHRWHAPTGER